MLIASLIACRVPPHCMQVRESPLLWPLVTAMLHVICRRDGNPFALTRLLRIPSVFGDLMRHDEAAASTTLNFLTFGMLQFDNPMFTEDAVQVILTLLREDDLGAASLLARRCSLPLLEALGTAACYLPSAMTALERLCAHRRHVQIAASHHASLLHQSRQLVFPTRCSIADRLVRLERTSRLT